MKDTQRMILYREFRGHIGSVYSIASDNSGYLYSVGGDGWIVQWDLNTASANGYLLAKSDAKLFSVCVLNDNNTLVAGDMTGFLFWIDISRKEILSVIKGHQSSVFDIIQISENQLITAAKDGYICYWDIPKRHPVQSYRINHKGLRCIERFQSEDILYLGGSDNHIHMFSNEHLHVTGTIDNAHSNSVFTILKLDETTLITGGRDAHMNEWDITDSPVLLQSLPAHWYTINSIINMAGTGLIASGSRDKTIRLWDDNTLQAIQKIDVQNGGHINSVNKLLWSEKHQLLISASDDRTIRLWSLK